MVLKWDKMDQRKENKMLSTVTKFLPILQASAFCSFKKVFVDACAMNGFFAKFNHFERKKINCINEVRFGSQQLVNRLGR